MIKVCYLPLRGVDNIIADKINAISGGTNWTPYRVATLRGMYDESQNLPLDISNLDKAAETLLGYRDSIARKNAKEINATFKREREKKGKQVGKSFKELQDQLKQAFPLAEERYNRTTMIATMFSKAIDAIKKRYPELSRSTICKGIKIKNSTVGGEFNIFNIVFNNLLNYYAGAIEDEDIEEAEKYKRVLDNFTALATYARIRLRDTEGIKLGDKLAFADDTNEGNYAADDFTFDPPQATREAWQEENDKKSAFGSISKEVRKFLGTIQKYDDSGEEMYDDLSFPIMLDPVQAHQQIADILRGVTSESQMMSIFRKEVTKQPWLTPIIKGLSQNDRLKTQFYVDFHKGFQMYSMLKETLNNGIKTFKTIILNRQRREDLLNQYITQITLGKSVNKFSLYSKDGNVNWGNIQSFIDLIDSNLSIFGESQISWKKALSFSEKRNVVSKILSSLGIDIAASDLNKILLDYKTVNTILLNSVQLVDFGIKSILEKRHLQALTRGENLDSRKFIDFISTRTSSSSAEEGNIAEKIGKIVTAVYNKTTRVKIEHRARFKDSKGNTTSYDSYVNPSYLSDRLDKIASFVTNEDQAGLQKFIEDNFLKSSYFYDRASQIGDKIDPNLIRNQWLRDLYLSFNEKTGSFEEDSFAANFTFERFLGDNNDNVFENFTSKQHAIALLELYFSDKQISKNSKYAHYPVFILGDSGVAKFIKAKRYSSQEILDGMYQVYLQERQRMKLTKAANAKLKADKYSLIDNFSSKENQFSILQFLNDERYSSMIDEAHLKQSVKKAITAYMKDAVDAFKVNLENLGVLETKEIKQSNGITVNQYVNISQDATPKNIDQVLEEYYWNNKYAMINQLQFFTIDPAFYKGTKDLQKRYKEIHAPGTILSIEARDFNGNLYSDNGIERCIYFDDIELPADDAFLNAIESHFGKDSRYKKYLENTLTDGQGYRSLDSYRKVRGMAGQWTEEHENAYQEIKSLEARYRGQQIPMEDLERIAELAVVFQPIKPYMFTHEKYAINSTDCLLIPVQHKYAEAVLIPELLPPGLLKDMAYYMQDNNIDMIGSTKIVKVGGFGAANIKGVTNADDLRDALSKGYVHQLSYSDYRIQTNVPEHINSSQLFGTQLRKLIMANIDMGNYKYEKYIDGAKVNLGDGKLTRLTGRNLIAFYNSLIISNIVDSYNQFSKQTSNIEDLSNILIQSTIANSRESMDNLTAFALTEDGRFSVPLFEGSLEHDSSAMLFSIFKKMVNKQTIDGGSAVQVSALGIDGYNESGNLKYIVDPRNPSNVLYAECECPFDLSVTDKSGNKVALNFADWCNADGTLILGRELDESDPEYTKYLSYTDENGNVHKPKIEERFPDILSIVAYRIPTERDYSMINLKVKRFSQKTAGGTIKVPVQGTTISGFDFDIDKLYFMRREYQLTEDIDEASDSLMEALFGEAPIAFEEYDFSKSPLENTRAARNNMLINLIQQRLMDEDTFGQRYTPGGFAQASNAARKMRELLFGDIENYIVDGNIDFTKLNEQASKKNADPEPNYDPTDVMTIITYNQQNQVAGKLIGIFANQNTNHAFASLMKSFTLKEPISFCGHSYGDLLNAPQGVDVDLNVAEFLSASVDAVKDPVLNFLNLNTITADAGAMLARIGYTTEEIGLLFNQPIIKDICEYSFNNSLPVDIAVREIMDSYRAVAAKEGPEASGTELGKALTRESLAKAILNDRVLRERGDNARNKKKFAESQIIVGELFSKILQASGDVTKFVTTSKFTASNAVGSTFGDLYAQQMRVNKYIAENKDNKLTFTVRVTDRISSTIQNLEGLRMSDSDYLMSLMDNPFGYEQAMYDMNLKVRNLLTKYFPYDTPAYKNTREFMASITKSGTLNDETINDIHRDILVYMLSQKEGSLFNGDQPINVDGNITTAREYYTAQFAQRLFNILESNPELKSYMIFNPQYMMFTTDENTGLISMNVQNIGGLQPYQKDALRESWEELDKNYPNLSRDLFMYNFYKLGFTFSPVAFMNLAPNSVKMGISVGKQSVNGEERDITYIDFLNSVLSGNVNISSGKFAKQFILNHLDNRKFAFYPTGESLKYAKQLYIKGDTVQREFDLDVTALGENAKNWTIGTIGSEENKEVVFKPCIVFKDAIYIANGDGSIFNSSPSGAMKYIKVDKLGASNVSMAYHSISETVKDTTPMPTEPAGNTSIEPETTTGDTFNREDVIDKLVPELYEARRAANLRGPQGEFYSKSDIRTMLTHMEDSELQSIINDIKIACRKNGILVLDSEGNLMQNC